MRVVTQAEFLTLSQEEIKEFFREMKLGTARLEAVPAKKVRVNYLQARFTQPQKRNMSNSLQEIGRRLYRANKESLEYRKRMSDL